MTRGRNEQSGAEAERKLRGRADAKLIRGNAGRQTGEAKSRRKNASDESTVLSIPSLYRFEGSPEKGEASSCLARRRQVAAAP